MTLKQVHWRAGAWEVSLCLNLYRWMYRYVQHWGEMPVPKPWPVREYDIPSQRFRRMVWLGPLFAIDTRIDS